MLKYFSLLLCSAFLLFSCDQKASHEKAVQFANSIHAATTGDIKAAQQAFVDDITVALKAVKQDSTATIDTKALRESLNKAKEANHKSLVALNIVTEVDNSIKLKEKAIAENESMGSLFEHEFTEILDILESNAPGKMASLDKLVAAFSAKENDILTIQRNAKEASYDFEKKYNIDMPAGN